MESQVHERANYPSPTVAKSALAEARRLGSFRGRRRESGLLRRPRTRISAQLRTTAGRLWSRGNSGARLGGERCRDDWQRERKAAGLRAQQIPRALFEARLMMEPYSAEAEEKSLEVVEDFNNELRSALDSRSWQWSVRNFQTELKFATRKNCE